jgi:hypothetical protein
VNKIRPNPFFPGESKPLSNAIGVVWRELATAVNGLIDSVNGDGDSTRWRGGIDTTDDVIIDDSDSGLVLKDTDGVYWRVQISTAGALTTTSLGTTKP